MQFTIKIFIKFLLLNKTTMPILEMERWANTVKTICFKLFQKWAIKPGGNPIPKHQCPTLCDFHLHKQNLSFRASLNENGQQHRHQSLPNKRRSCLCYFPPKRFFSQNISYHILCFQKAPEGCTLAVPAQPLCFQNLQMPPPSHFPYGTKSLRVICQKYCTQTQSIKVGAVVSAEIRLIFYLANT